MPNYSFSHKSFQKEKNPHLGKRMENKYLTVASGKWHYGVNLKFSYVKLNAAQLGALPLTTWSKDNILAHPSLVVS